MKLTARTKIQANFYRLWHVTQTPAQHVRWDLRFNEIEYLPKANASDPQKFRYLTRLGFGITIEGWGETVNTREASPTSALRFGSDDPKSLIREGSGCWIYRSVEDGVDFSTIYDYQVRYGWSGQLVDRVVFRPLMIWATRWSFDRLRLWLEEEISPELALRLWLLKILVRVALGLVWLITVTANNLVSMFIQQYPTFEMALAGLSGLGLVALAVWIFSGKAERAAALTLSALIALITMSGFCPAALVMSLGSLITISLLARCTPKASRAHFTLRKGQKSKVKN